MLLRRALCTAWLALALVAVAGPAVRADAASSARKAIQAAYDRDTAAYPRLDLKEVLSNCAPDFIGIDEKGKKQNRADLKRLLMALRKQVRSMSYHARIDKFAAKGRSATLTVSERLSYTGPDRNRRLVTITIDSTSDETWALRGKRWLRTLSKTTSERMQTKWNNRRPHLVLPASPAAPHTQ